MAYPGEQEYAAYQQYVIDTQSSGQEAMPIEQWRQQMKKSANPADGMQSAIEAGLGYETQA